MDRMKLFGLLISAMVYSVAADGTRKKIRIHLPQKVKHIHHHNKVYITQHSATAQYAPAYLPTAEASMDVPTAAVAGILPLNPAPLYEERRSGRIHGVNAANSPLLPLYRARGYYGPSLSWDRPGRGRDSYLSPGLSAPGISSDFERFNGPSSSSLRLRVKPRVKVVKINDTPRKKTIGGTKKSKRVIIHDLSSANGEHPVSNFHENFYSDVETGSTIQKIRKPKRVEKFVDGDTEHIHTYSEEHVHKLVFDNIPKVADLTPLTGLVGPSPIIPIVSAPPMLAIGQTLQHPVVAQIRPSFNAMTSAQGSVGSMGTPAHLEYMAYNSHDATNDHSYHEHGETVDQAEFMKDFDPPPKPSYNKYYPKTKRPLKFRKPRLYSNKWVPQDNIVRAPKQLNDHSYYDNLNGPTQRPNQYKHYVLPNSYSNSDEYSSDISNEDYRSYSPRPKGRLRSRNVDNSFSHHGNRKPHRLPYYSHDFDFSTSSPSSHESPFRSTRESYSSHRSPSSGFTNYRDQFSSFKDVYTPQDNYEFDNYAAPSTTHKESREIVVLNPNWPIGATGKKKSISTQNISFGGQDHQMVVDHMADSSNISPVIVMGEESMTTELSENSIPTKDFKPPTLIPEHENYLQMAVRASKEILNTVSDTSTHTYQTVHELPPQISPSTTTGTTTTTMTTTTSPAPMRIYTQYTTTYPTAVASFVSTHTMKIPKAKSTSRRTLPNSDTARQKPENPLKQSSFRQRKTIKPNEAEKVVKKLRSYERVKLRSQENSSRNQKNDENIPPSVPDQEGYKYGDRL